MTLERAESGGRWSAQSTYGRAQQHGELLGEPDWISFETPPQGHRMTSYAGGLEHRYVAIANRWRTSVITSDQQDRGIQRSECPEWKASEIRPAAVTSQIRARTSRR